MRWVEIGLCLRWRSADTDIYRSAQILIQIYTDSVHYSMYAALYKLNVRLNVFYLQILNRKYNITNRKRGK